MVIRKVRQFRRIRQVHCLTDVAVSFSLHKVLDTPNTKRTEPDDVESVSQKKSYIFFGKRGSKICLSDIAESKSVLLRTRRKAAQGQQVQEVVDAANILSYIRYPYDRLLEVTNPQDMQNPSPAFRLAATYTK